MIIVGHLMVEKSGRVRILTKGNGCAGQGNETHPQKERKARAAITIERERKKKSLTSSNNCSPPSASLCTPSTKCEDHPQPSHTKGFAIPVKVRNQGACSLEWAHLAGVRRVADCQDGFEPTGAAGDGTAVDEGVETGAATVGAIATFAYTSEGKGRNVQGGIVD